MKLNLGSGNKPLVGYVNVDLNPPASLPEGVEFVKDDVIQLEQFEDNTVDEIITSHLIEHIHPYQVDLMLYNWLQVLKPQGKLVIECPDLIKCCINFLQTLTTQDDTLVLRKGIIGIYGEPHHKDEALMGHRWGYYPKSLTKIVERVGFINVSTSDHTEFKPKELFGRDFRLEAYKP